MFLPRLTITSQSGPRRKLTWLLAGLLLVALSFAGWTGYGVFKHRQARRLIRQAETLAGQKQWTQAREKVLAALELAQDNPLGLRLAAQLYARQQRPEAFAYWDQFFTQQRPTTADFLEVLDLALATRRFDIAETYLNRALGQKPVSLKIVRAAALICAAKGDTPRAIYFARIYLKQLPGDVEMTFLLARQLLSTTNAEAQNQACGLLWQVARTQHPLAARALSLLAAQPDLPRAQVQQCLNRLQEYPDHDILRDLLMQDLKLKLAPKQRAEILAAAIKQYQDGTPAEQVVLARWLNEKGECKTVTQVVSLAAALRNQDLFLVYGDALASQGAWTELDAILTKEKLPIEPVLVELYRARVARELKQDRQAATHWAQAHWLANDNPRALQYLAEYAERMGETAEAIKANRRLTREPATARKAYLALIRLAERNKDTSQLRSLMKELIARYPDDPAPRIDLAYLDLLAGKNLDTAKAVAQTLYKQHPDMLAYRTTLALAYLRHHEIPAAQSLYRDLKLDWSAMLPGWQAVQTAVAGACGEKATARKMAQAISRDRLKPEERALIQPWL